MIDIHCHLEYMNPDTVIKEAKEKMLGMISSVADIKHKEKILELGEKNPGFVFVSLGLHPERVSRYSDDEINDYISFIKANRKKIVAIGECGLDYLQVREEDRKRAEDYFIHFINLARELKLPLVVHSRNQPGSSSCIDDVIKVLEKNSAESVVLHCFSGSESNLKKALDYGYWISIATIICKSEKHQRIAGKTPIEKMLLETDSPWLHPSSREMINRPWMIAESAKIIAEIKNITAEEVLQQTAENAKKVFNLRI